MYGLAVRVLALALAYAACTACGGGKLAAEPSANALPGEATTMPSGWKEIVSKDGGFTIWMPSEPQKETRTKVTRSGPMASHMLVAEQPGGTTYVAVWTGLPSESFATTKPDSILDDARDSIFSDRRKTLTAERIVPIRGVAARELLYKDHAAVFAHRLYVVDSRLIQNIVVMPADHVVPADVRAFLDSFRLVAP